jgi:hypothetical protein
MKLKDVPGVNVHMGYPAYADTAKVIGALNWLGVTWVRENSLLGVGKLPGFRVQTICNTAADIAKVLALKPWRIELPNESDNQKKDVAGGWGPWQRQAATDIAKAIDRRIPLVGSSLANISAADVAALTRENPAIDLANLHCYRGNRTQQLWLANQQQFLALARSLNPNRPLVVTETGTHDKMDWTGGHVPTPPDVWAQQIIPDLLGWLALGVERVCYYELVDQVKFRKTDDNEGHFGLFDSNWQPKPAAVKLKEFLAAYGQFDLVDVPALVDAHAIAGNLAQSLTSKLTTARQLTSQLSVLLS